MSSFAMGVKLLPVFIISRLKNMRNIIRQWLRMLPLQRKKGTCPWAHNNCPGVMDFQSAEVPLVKKLLTDYPLVGGTPVHPGRPVHLQSRNM